MKMVLQKNEDECTYLPCIQKPGLIDISRMKENFRSNRQKNKEKFVVKYGIKVYIYWIKN